MKPATIALILALSPVSYAQSRFALGDLERASGWVSMCDQTGASSWDGPDEGWTFQGETLRRAGGVKQPLVWKEALAEFEIDFDWCEPGRPDSAWRAGRIVARGDGSALALLGSLRVDRAANSGQAKFTAGPFELTHAPSRPGWRIELQPGEAAFELRGIRLRDRAEPIGKVHEIFDGKTLDGWSALGDARFSIENGDLVGEVGGGAQSFLCTQAVFADFVLEVDLKNDMPGNSGIQVRSSENSAKRLRGYQIEIDPSPRAWSGGLYDEARRGWLDDLSDNPHGRAAFKNGEWNHYRIECVGPWIRAWVNDVPTADYLDAKDLEGKIGLQVHSGSDTKMRWRNFRLRELGRSRWEEFPKDARWREVASADSDSQASPDRKLREDALQLGKQEGDLLLGYGLSRPSVEPTFCPIERIRLLGPDWTITVPLGALNLRGDEVIILCHPPRLAIEVDGQRISDLNFEPAREASTDRPIEAWIQRGSQQSLAGCRALRRD